MFGKQPGDATGTGEARELDIICPDRASAQAEAERRQALERDGAEWIYLCRDRDRQWVARRWVDDRVDRGSGSGVVGEVIAEAVVEALNPLTWLQP